MRQCSAWPSSHLMVTMVQHRACTLSRSVVPDSATPWTAARQAPLSIGFSRQEYWSGLPCPLPGDLPDPGIESESLTSPMLVGRFFTTKATWASITLGSSPPFPSITSEGHAWLWVCSENSSRLCTHGVKRTQLCPSK